MLWPIITHATIFIAGGLLGFVTCACLTVASDADDRATHPPHDGADKIADGDERPAWLARALADEIAHPQRELDRFGNRHAASNKSKG